MCADVESSPPSAGKETSVPAPCCAPESDRAARDSETEERGEASASARTAAETEGMVDVPGGEFAFGSDDEHAYPDDGEGPVRRVSVDALRIDRYAVSNARFAAFVEATGHVTDAERFGWSFVFAGLLPDDFPPTRDVTQAPWWRAVEGATWDHPAGPESSIGQLLDHPVVHVPHNDACRYCAGPGPVYRPRPSGSSRLGADSRVRSTPGEAISSLTERIG